jgi:hypothetical protein
MPAPVFHDEGGGYADGMSMNEEHTGADLGQDDDVPRDPLLEGGGEPSGDVDEEGAEPEIDPLDVG